MTGTLRTAAPAKVNLCLYVGPLRPDGLHELVSVFQPLDLVDELTLEPAAHDEVVCPEVEGENLAERALRAYRDAAGTGAAHRLTIAKRIPVAAGLGGGSSDAAATLRLAAHATGAPQDPRLHDLATDLGSDVPALLHETPTLVTGAGEEVTPLDGPALAGDFSYALLPSPERLSAANVYAEADRLGAAQPADALAVRRINELAFARPDEADLVDAFRVAAAVTLSLVGEIDGDAIGHVLFTPVDIDTTKL